MSSLHFDSDADSLSEVIASFNAADPFVAAAAARSDGAGGVRDSSNVATLFPGTGATSGVLQIDTTDEITGMLIDPLSSETVLPDVNVLDKKRRQPAVTPSTKYRLFCLPTTLGDLENFCLGLIGQGSSFCIKENCMTFHVGPKANVFMGDIHVMKTNETCFVEPTINRRLLDEDLYTLWMNERVVLDEWTNRFAILKNSTSKVSSESFKELSTFATTAKKFKPAITPRSDLPDTKKLELLLNDVFKVRVYEPQISGRETFVQENDNNRTKALSSLIGIVQAAESSLEEVTTGLIATNNQVELVTHRVQNEIPILFSRQENLEAVVGVRAVGTLPSYESPTLWGTLSLLSDILTETRKQMDEIHSEQWNLKTDATTVASKVAKELVLQETSGWDKKLISMRESIASNIKTLLTRMNRDTGLIIELQDKVKAIDTLMKTNKSSDINIIKQDNTGHPDLVGLELRGFRDQLSKLEASVRNLETQELKDAVKFARLGFRNIGEAEAWIEKHQPGDYTFGLVVDVHMVFEHVYVKLNSGDASQSTITRLDALRKLGVKSLNLGIALTSFDTQIPKIFAKDESSPHSKHDESFFDQILDYEAWDLTDYGHRDKILNQIHTFKLSHKDAINNHQAMNKDAMLYNVASKSLTDSIAWIKSFFLYIDNTYDELTRNKFSSKRGWSLVTRLATAILKDVGSPRNGVNNLWVVGQNEKICTLMFYSVVKCHDIMERYKGYNFKSDPAISGEYVRFLVMNTGLESIHTLERKVSDLETAVNELKTVFKTLDTKHSATAGSLGDLKGKVAELTKKIKVCDDYCLPTHNDSFPLPSSITSDTTSINSEITRKRKNQVVDVNIFQKYEPVDVLLIFEHFPCWLLALELSWTKSIWIVGYGSEACMLQQLQRWGPFEDIVIRTLRRFSSDRVRYSVDIADQPQQVDLILLSGSLPFLTTYFEYFVASNRPVVGTVSGHFHQRFKFGRPSSIQRDVLPQVQWHRVRHKTVGGASDYVTVHGTVNCNPITPQVTSIRRTLADFINHKTRPQFLAKVQDCHQPPLLVTDRVSPLHWDQPVAYQTYFFASGWGTRSLTTDELGAIFSLPVRLRVGKALHLRLFDWISPIQSLLSILHPVLHHLSTINMRSNKRVCSHTPLPTVPPIAINTADPTVSNDRSWLVSIGRWLPHSWIVTDVITTGAAKRDDAAIPFHLWNKRLQLLYPGVTDSHLDCLRSFLLTKVVRRNVYRSFSAYLTIHYGVNWAAKLCSIRASPPQEGGEGGDNFDLLRDVNLGLDVIFRFAHSSWWDWNFGSALVFWRWPTMSQTIARDGMAPFICGQLPKFRRRSKLPKPSVLPLIAAKFETIITRKYLAPGIIKSFTQFFDVPKGSGDIRLVYNGTSCGFNAALWCPKFWLPTAKSALRTLDYDFYSVDMDLAEMFLNFPLHSSLQEYSGVDLTPYKAVLNIDSPGPLHLRWTRTWMGARPSPFYAVRFYYLADDFIRGNNLDPNNPFYWDSIKLNLPGSTEYDPSRPRVMKWNSLTNSIAAEVIVYVDDLRVQGRDVETAWRLAHLIATRLQYLGIQVAIRKHRPPTKTPGAWAGAIFKTTHDSVSCSVSQEKWEKAQKIVKDLVIEMDSKENTDNTLNYKNLEISRGFLVHLSMTFDVITHYLKGFHLALAAHNAKRDDEGWKMKENEWFAYLQDKVDRGQMSQRELDLLIDQKEIKNQPVENKSEQHRPKRKYPYDPPEKAKIVGQLKNDLYALNTFFSSDQPPHIEVRKKSVSLLLYGFADASGGGLGSTVSIPGKGIRYRIGVWGSDADDNSSNFREFENIVLTVEEEARNGTLTGSLMFLFTDNTTVEGALYKGNTSSKTLFKLVVRLRKIELEYDATIHVIHVAGKRMIAQGTDAISRGQLNEGVAVGIPMLNFVPLHQGALERHPPLRSWIQTWLGRDTEFLEPYDWFLRVLKLTVQL